MRPTSKSDPRGRSIAYLCDPMPTGGPDELLRQLRRAALLLAGRRIDLHVVDSGSRDVGGRGANLDALIAAGAAAPGADVVVFDGPQRLGRTRHAANRAVGDLLIAGFVLKDASGELHPSESTKALAVEAAEASARRGRPTSARQRPRKRVARPSEGPGHG